MTAIEKLVLRAFQTQCSADYLGCFAPYYPPIAKAAGGDLDAAYAACKSLKKRGFLEASGRQGAKLINAPGYWITDEGTQALLDA